MHMDAFPFNLIPLILRFCFEVDLEPFPPQNHIIKICFLFLKQPALFSSRATVSALPPARHSELIKMDGAIISGIYTWPCSIKHILPSL